MVVYEPSKLFERVMAFEKGSPPTLVTLHNSHMTNKKHYISTRLVATKLDKEMAYKMGQHVII